MSAPLMLTPGAVHGFTDTRDAVVHQITVPTATLTRLLGHADFVERELGASFVIAAGSQGGDMAQLFASVRHEFGGTLAGRMPALLGLAAQIGVQFVRRHGEHFALEKGRGIRDALAQRLLALVDRHHTEQHPLEFYADRLGVSADHLSCRRPVS